MKFNKEMADLHNTIELLSNSSYQAPTFNSVRNKDWIPYLDTDKSQFPDKLIYYKNNSSLHGAIIGNMTDQVAGNGFMVENEEDPLYQPTIDFLNQLGSEEDANEILSKVAADLCTFKGFALLVKWSKDGSKIIKADHIDFSKLRAAKVDEDGKIPGYYYSWNWNTQRPNAVFVPAFDTNSMSEKKKQYDDAMERAIIRGELVPELETFYNSPTEQILYVHPYAANEFYYPLPYYVAAINAINADILTDQYGVSMMDNGLSSNHIVNFKGNYTPEQKKEAARKFDNAYIRGIKKGRPVIVFSKDSESSVEITSIQSNGKDSRYTSINENATQKILSGHSVTSPMLVGIKEAGSLGGSEEIKIASELFYRNTIRPKMNTITKVFNNILSINNLLNVSIERLKIIDDNNEIK